MFLAGCSYGLMVPLVRTSQGLGFDTGEIMVSQYLVSSLALAIGCLIFSRIKVRLRDALKLMGVGMVAAGVSFFYYQSLQTLTPALSLTLLFQFVWMGMVVQAVRTRTLPKATALVAVVLVVIGAVFAAGVLDEGVSWTNFNLMGILCGFLAAVCYTGFLVLSSQVATALPAANRSMFTTFGSLVISVVISPLFVARPLVLQDPFLGLALGLLGICLPVFLIALSSPKLPNGLTTIMASSELPSGVLCAAVFLGVPVTFTIGLGVVVVLVGIVTSEFETLRSLGKKNKGGQTPQRE